MQRQDVIRNLLNSDENRRHRRDAPPSGAKYALGLLIGFVSVGILLVNYSGGPSAPPLDPTKSATVTKILPRATEKAIPHSPPTKLAATKEPSRTRSAHGIEWGKYGKATVPVVTEPPRATEKPAAAATPTAATAAPLVATVVPSVTVEPIAAPKPTLRPIVAVTEAPTPTLEPIVEPTPVVMATVEPTPLPTDEPEPAVALSPTASEQEYTESIYNEAIRLQEVGAPAETIFNLFQRAAELGHRDGQYETARCFRNGKGTTKDLAEAARYYELAAQKGHADAQCSLGAFYYRGLGVDKSPQLAVHWFEKAALQGDRAAQFNLGGCYLEGTGVKQDQEQAIKWYRESAKNGYRRAAKALEELGLTP